MKEICVSYRNLYCDGYRLMVAKDGKPIGLYQSWMDNNKEWIKYFILL